MLSNMKELEEAARKLDECANGSRPKMPCQRCMSTDFEIVSKPMRLLGIFPTSSSKAIVKCRKCGKSFKL